MEKGFNAICNPLFSSMTQMKLYEITHQIIDTQHQEVDENQLQQLKIDFRQKAIACSGVIKNFDSSVESIDNKIKRLKERKQVSLNKKERLKSYLLQEMKQTGIQRIEEGSHRVSVRRSSLKVQVEEPNQIPEEFQQLKTEYRIDRTAILKHVKQTGEIPLGCQVKQSEYVYIN